jgi:hypothetical protein
MKALAQYTLCWPTSVDSLELAAMVFLPEALNETKVQQIKEGQELDGFEGSVDGVLDSDDSKERKASQNDVNLVNMSPGKTSRILLTTVHLTESVGRARHPVYTGLKNAYAIEEC